ncbi:MAG TPA: DUF5686 family protein [Bacteroidales bacterium]|nr:DUF5686 family protein [Bacteroidales bacterium]
MNAKIILVIFFSYLSLIAESQVIKGRISNESGDPVPYATVYIHELRQGTTANGKGDYEIRIPEGRYQISYQCLGYSPLTYDITVKGKTSIKDVSLSMQYYQIPEVKILATGEDPAYGIMRKAIGMAPYYLNNTEYYKAEVYLKGNLVFKKIPRLLQKRISITTNSEEDNREITRRIMEGDIFMLESFNEVEFTAPDSYVQKVISVNSTFPEEGENVSPMDFIQASFYQPLLADLAISPLSPQAFSYYRFRYLGATTQGNITLNKIQVIPRMKSQQLFEGTIYIIEDLWCLHSVDLINDNIAGRISIQQLYVPVQDDIWLPVSHNFVINIGVLGVRADAEYLSSVRYIEVRPNLSLRKPSSVTTDSFRRHELSNEKNISDKQQKIEEILKDDEMTNRDMIRLARLMNKESEKAQHDSIRESLEIKDNTVRTIADDAYNKDSAYWAEIRPIPLSEPEIKSVMKRDSILMEKSSGKDEHNLQNNEDKKEQNKFISVLSNLAFGHTWSDTTDFSFNYGGLLDPDNFSFSTVDGFVHGLDFRISKKWKDASQLTISPEMSYAFSRESFIWRVNGNYLFDRKKNQQIFFNAGMISRDISDGGSVNKLINTVSSLFAENNILKLYGSDYLSLGYRTTVSNGLIIEINGGLDNRKLLDNTTDFSFIRTDQGYSDNKPENPYLEEGTDPVYSLRDMKHYHFGTEITYTPRQRYRMSNGVRIPQGSDWPSFRFTWKHGINDQNQSSGTYSHFDKIKFLAYKESDMGAFSTFRWRIETGFFLNKSQLNYFDFFHFNTQPLLLTINDYQDAFRLPPFYSLSTPGFYVEAHSRYTTPYLMIKYLPGLSKTLMRENLSFSYIGSDYHRHYMEIGYSISEISLIGEFGVYAGFENLRYKNIGVRFILKIN